MKSRKRFILVGTTAVLFGLTSFWSISSPLPARAADSPPSTEAPKEGEVKEKPDGIRAMMAKHGLTASVGALTPTVCDLCGIPRPNVCSADPLPDVLKLAAERFGDLKAEKVLIFCPDAIGNVQFEKFPNEFPPLLETTDVLVKGTNVLPSVTPVCFATIFTGAPPAVHGIEKYSRPVLQVETLFDVFEKAGKKVAIVAESDCSIDLIFRKRPVDYFSFPTNEESFLFTQRLLRDFDYDLIVCYDGGYDSAMHATGIASPKSLDALRDSVRRWAELVKTTDECWAGKRRIAVFAPDHGSHDSAPGQGTHGSDSADDAIVNHAWRIRK